jgi:hypothetical protein
MKTSDDKKNRLFVNAEPVARARTICRKRGADYTDAELALLCVVPLARGAGRNGRESLSEDFEAARAALCQPWHGTHRPAGQPANTMEHWLKVFMRHPDAAIEIMAMARAVDANRSKNPIYRALRELPADMAPLTVNDKAREIAPQHKAADETDKAARQKINPDTIGAYQKDLRKLNKSAGLVERIEEKQRGKKGQKSPP